MSKIKTSELLEKLKLDLQAATELRDQEDAKIAARRSTHSGLLYGNEEEGKSKIVPKVAKRQSEWAHASLKDPFVSTPDIVKCYPITYEDVKAARQSQLLLNNQFCRQFGRYDFMTKAIKVLDVDATLVVQTGWQYEDKKVKSKQQVVKTDEYGNEFITEDIVEDTVVLVNKPTAKVCRNEDVFVDPTCQDDIDNAQFIIYRYETDYSTLKQDGRYKNIDKVVIPNSDDEPDDGSTHTYVSEDTTSFTFKDKPRKKMIVYEYWGNYDLNGDGIAEAMVCAWVGHQVIRLENNPYPDKKPPFLIVPFSSVPFQLAGENNMDLIADNQKVITALTRGFINNMAQSTNGQVGVQKGALDPTQRKKFFKGQNFEFNTSPNAFWQGSYNQIPGSAFDMLTLMNNEVESLTGTKGFAGGVNTSGLSGSATAAKGTLDAVSVRRLDLVKNLAENLIKPLMRKWLAYDSEFLSEEEVVRVTNEEFVPVRRDDLDGNIDIDIEISTAEDNNNRSQQLSFLLQTLGNSVPFELTQKVLAKIAKLNRVPDLEQEILQFQPKPDPAEERIKELQAKKLEAEIAEIQSRSTENAADYAEKEAKARVETAKAVKLEAEAGKIKSEKDNLDLSFVKTNNETDATNKANELAAKYAHELEKEKLKHAANMQSMAYQAANNDNIGVER